MAPDLQGHGLGRRLTVAVEEALAGRVDRFELFTGATSEGDLRLYRRLGYVDSGWGREPPRRGSRTWKSAFELFLPACRRAAVTECG